MKNISNHKYFADLKGGANDLTTIIRCSYDTPQVEYRGEILAILEGSELRASLMDIETQIQMYHPTARDFEDDRCVIANYNITNLQFIRASDGYMYFTGWVKSGSFYPNPKQTFTETGIIKEHDNQIVFREFMKVEIEIYPKNFR